MLRISFFRLACSNCHTEYKVRVDQYSSLVLRLEQRFRLEGDTAIPR